MRIASYTLPLLAITVTTNIPAAEPDNRLFEMRVYYAAPGKLDDLHSRFRDHTLKFFEKHGITNVGYFTPIENPENKLVYFLAYDDAKARNTAWARFLADPDMQRVFTESEANGRLVARFESLFLRPTDYSPTASPSATDEERIFELRTYTATPGNLDDLNARFRNHTLKLFVRHGMTNICYWTLATGDGVPKANACALENLGGCSRDWTEPCGSDFDLPSRPPVVGRP